MTHFLLIIILVCVALPVGAAERKAIEIYAGGKRYVSMEAYRNRRVQLQEVKATTEQNQDMQETAKALGVDLDPKKIKTIEVKPILSTQTEKKLRLVGAQDGIKKEIADFEQNWSNPNPQKPVTSLELEDKIREAVGGQQDPVLLISDHGKMRVMALTPQDPPKVQ